MSNSHTLKISQPTTVSLPLKKRRQTEVIVRKIEIKPSDYVRSAFKANGFNVNEVKSIAESSFIKPTKEMLDAYPSELMNLVRRNDFEGLKVLHNEGRLINCCNKFGESLLHLACRRGHTHIVEYLIAVAEVNIMIRDDYLRTPLHDACWTAEPNFDLVYFLIQKAPEQLVLEDARGFTPFDYVRKEHQGKWLRFLWERRTQLHPRTGDDVNQCTSAAP